MTEEQQSQDSYDSVLYDFYEAINTLRSNKRTIVYDASSR